jgi:hypothetical protein
MLTDEELDFFRAFGYVVAGDSALAAMAEPLHQESAQALRTAYPDGPSGSLLLPAMSEATTPCSFTLTHDRRLLRCVRQLLGRDAIVKPAKITRFAKVTNWHRDCYMNLRGVKFAVYLGPPGEELVPFDVIPTSHEKAVRGYIDRLFERGTAMRGAPRNPNRVMPSEIPTETLRLRHGQLLVFDLGLWHANLSPAERLQWAITFVAAPDSATARDDVVLHLAEFFEYSRPYPREKFPYLPPSWERRESDSELYQAMDSSGVLDLYLERYGAGR